MSFNPLMTLLARGFVDLVAPHPCVMELGNQTFKAGDHALDVVIDRSRDCQGVDLDALQALRRIPAAQRRTQTQDYYRALGFAEYKSIDVNDLSGSLIMDLNRRVRDAYDYQDTFSVVTNNGTGEHIFNQTAIFQNVHDLTRPGGLMVHVMPFIGYVNHGFYGFHPNLYHALARSNGYCLITLGVATRTGLGFLAAPEGNQESLPLLLRENRLVPLTLILSGAKLPKAGFKGLVARVMPTNERRRFHAEIRRLQHDRPNLLVFAILRKVEDSPFRFPIQTRYSADIASEELQREYEVQD